MDTKHTPMDAREITRLLNIQHDNIRLREVNGALIEGLEIIAGTNYGIEEAKNIARRLLKLAKGEA